MHRLLVDRLEVDALPLASERDAQLVDDERPAVRDRDAAADARRAEILSPLEHLEQHAFGLLVELEQRDQLAQNVVLGRSFQIKLDCIFAEELAQFHRARFQSVNLRSYPALETVSNADVACTSALS